MRCPLRFTFLLGLLALVPPARAVIVFDASDAAEAAHTARPDLPAGGGWDYEGPFNAFLGTPIGPRHFLTAAHVRGGPGQELVFAGQTFHTVRGYADPAGSDLFVWEVDGTFPRFAPLFDRPGAEVGRGLYVFGRGARRGGPVHVPAGDPAPGTLAGWAWGNDAYVQRWGRNVVDRIEEGYLVANFDAPGTADAVGADEAALSTNDSGGGVFLQDGGVWKLAGINYGVSGPYSYAASGAGAFSASLFQPAGLYENGGSDGYVPATGPSLFAATAVASRLGFIRVATGQTSLARVGDDVLYGFPSEEGRSYRVEFCNDLLGGSWQALPGGDAAGNGGIVLVTDPGAAGQLRRFYRAVALP